MNKVPVSGRELVLASMCYKEQKSSTSMKSLSESFYSNPDESIQEIADYDFTYLLKCKFYKEAHQ